MNRLRCPPYFILSFGEFGRLLLEVGRSNLDLRHFDLVIKIANPASEEEKFINHNNAICTS